MKVTVMLFLLLGSTAMNVLAQADFISDSTEVMSAERPQNVQSLPESVLIRHERGQAPFFVRVRMYARWLDSAISDDKSESAKKTEMEALGASLAVLEQIRIDLQVFKNKQQSRWNEQLKENCLEINKIGVSNREARSILAKLDDRDADLNALANQTLNTIANRLGSNLRNKLEKRINEVGENIKYTRVDLVKQIESTEGGNFAAYITSKCQALG